jgi:queuine tRNA-ribosyltransferase
MQFTLAAQDRDTNARAARLETAHGTLKTPVFMPVGTLGSVKAIPPRSLVNEIHAQIVLGNTYHLYLRPGTKILKAAGGLHAFMSWSGPILTDSGGYQVFSLADLREISEEGVEFQSHIDGSSHMFTPESVVDTQRVIGSDIMMVLDECPPADVDKAYARKANERTIRWAARCQKRFRETDSCYGYDQALFPIVQGGVYPDVRRESARQLVERDFEGYAVGGLSVGESHDLMYEMVEVVTEILPTSHPRYLMGVGTPENLLENIARGIDMFDCVMPTRNGRNGMLFTTQGEINIRNARWKNDHSPLDPALETHVSQTFSKAYLRHLVKSNELLALQIASVQNLRFYHWLMEQARQAILDGEFAGWKREIQPRISRRL